jgi:hypothetical protein
LAFGIALVAHAAAQHAAEQRDMALVGHDDLQARSAYQPTIHRQGNRWIAYIGHHGGMKRNPLTGADEQNGTSVVDVTDPKKPRYLAHIPGEHGYRLRHLRAERLAHQAHDEDFRPERSGPPQIHS